jgi:hypothetical protein
VQATNSKSLKSQPILCVKLKVHETLKITVKVENNGENVRLVLEGEARETLKIEAAEETAPSMWVKNMKCVSAG